MALAPAGIGLLVLLARAAGRRGPADSLHVVWGVDALLHAASYPLLHTTWHVAPAAGALTMLGGLAVTRASPAVVVLGASVALLVVTGADLATRPWVRAPLGHDRATAAEHRRPGWVISGRGPVVMIGAPGPGTPHPACPVPI